MIKINGRAVQADELKLSDALAELGFEAKKIAVEVNEIIIPKAQYSSCILHSGDVVEVVSFVGGG